MAILGLRTSVCYVCTNKIKEGAHSIQKTQDPVGVFARWWFWFSRVPGLSYDTVTTVFDLGGNDGGWKTNNSRSPTLALPVGASLHSLCFAWAPAACFWRHCGARPSPWGSGTCPFPPLAFFGCPLRASGPSGGGWHPWWGVPPFVCGHRPACPSYGRVEE